ncbi:MAG: hypothetical protein FJX18_06890, partial [Alphaproteobacteria bacterium]|nr:hypothetical protein [Alphaproteobacteria bacterium]
MALFHQRCRILTRSHGKSPVASSAYQSGEKLKEARTNSTYDYSKPEVGDKGILAPSGSPSWVYSREELWNRVEAFEDQMIQSRYSVSGKTGEAKAKTLAARENALSSAQTAQVSERSLPVELTLEQNIALVKKFFEECYVSKGFIVDYAIHMDEGNPHVHYMVPLRCLEGKTFAKKKETSYRRTKDVRNLFDRGGMKEVAALWCKVTNEALREAGINAQIDHRSYKERGIDLVPMKHRGYNADKIEREGGKSRIVHEEKEIRLENLRRVLKNPMILLKKVAGERVIFRREEVEQALWNLVSVDMEAYEILRDKMDSFMMREAANQNGDERIEELVQQWVAHILRPQRESFWSRVLAFARIKPTPDFAKHVADNLYTFKSIENKENRITQLVDDLSSKVMKPTLVQRSKEPIDIAKEVKGIEQSLTLTFTEEQRVAIDHLMKEDRIQVLSGRAGTGKTTLLRAVCDLYQKQGYQIMGTAFQGRVVEALQRDLNHPAYTLSKLVSVWDYYKGPLSPRAQQTLNHYSFTRNHVVILDEGSMVPDNLWESLLLKVKETGAKLIIVQDQMQIKALYGLDIPRYVEEKAGACVLENVVRQEIPWQREASRLLNDHYTLQGLKMYEAQGRIIPEEQQIVDDFLKSFNQEAEIMLALSNKDVDRLNQEAFKKLLERGVLQSHFTHYDKEFAIGARVMFGKNDMREKEVKTLEGCEALGVKNGTRGIIIAHDTKRGEIRVKLGDGRVVGFTDYENLSLAYAMTINKSQGATFGKTFVLHHPLMDANKILVALTRHREDVRLYGSKSVEEMARGGEYKPLIRDYTLTEVQETFKQLVQAYRESHKNLALAMKKGEGIKEVADIRKAYAADIIKSWDQTKLFVMQSGLRKELIERHAGMGSQRD